MTETLKAYITELNPITGEFERTGDKVLVNGDLSIASLDNSPRFTPVPKGADIEDFVAQGYELSTDIKIAFIGKARAGKDTACNFIQTELDSIGYDTAQYAFAGKLKEVVGIISDSKNKNREELVEVGEKLREYDPDIWVKALAKHIADDEEFYNFLGADRFDETCKATFITDVRRVNEADWCVANGYKLVYISSWEAKRVGRSSIAEIRKADKVDDYVDDVVAKYKGTEHFVKIDNNSNLDAFEAKLFNALMTGGLS